MRFICVRGRCRFLFAVLLFLVFAGPVDGKGQSVRDSDYILIIDSYIPSLPWSRGIIDVVSEDIFARNPDLIVCAEHMNVLGVDSEEKRATFRDFVIGKYRSTPRMILYLGNESWTLLHEDFETEWPDVPVVLLATRDYTGPREAFYQKKAIAVQQRIPLREAVQSHEMTVVCLPVYFRETIRLMYDVIPDMNELIFISDRRWISAECRAELGEVVREEYPGLKLRFLTEGEVSTDSMFMTLRAIDRRTGVLFSSWLQKDMQSGSMILNTSTYKIVGKYASQPVFALRDIGISDGGLFGGYCLSEKSVFTTVTSVVDGILSGVRRDGREFVRPADPVPIVNYTVLTNRKVPADRLSSGTVFYGKPPGIFSLYKYHILGLLFSVTVLLLVIYILVKEKKAQRKEIALVADYMSLFDNMPIVYMEQLLYRDAAGNPFDFKILKVNPVFEKYFGAKESLVGKKGSELGERIRKKFPDFFRLIGLYREDEKFTFQYHDESVGRDYSVIVTASKKPDHADLFLVDNSELMRTQQVLCTANHKLSMALDVANITAWKWELGSDLIFYDVSRPLESILEAPADEVRVTIAVEQYFAMIHKNDRARVRRAMDDLIAGRIGRVKEEYRVFIRERHKTRFEWIEVQAAVDIRDGDGDPVTLVGSSLVITARKKLENELISAKEKAEESNRLKSAFLANMSHEIRTPLNAIVGFAGILAGTQDEAEKQEYVRIIENNNELLLQLIGDILDLSKIEAGTLEFVFTEVELHGLLTEIVHAFRLRVDPQRIRVELEACPAECRVRAERNRLTQVLTNLLANAVKFTKEGSVGVGCEVRRESGFIYFWVRDTGCGIPKAKLDAIFSRFVKLNSFSQGTGLGLSICKTIIEHVGGEIGVESEEEKGSRFWFTIPFRPVPGQQIPES